METTQQVQEFMSQFSSSTSFTEVEERWQQEWFQVTMSCMWVRFSVTFGWSTFQVSEERETQSDFTRVFTGRRCEQVS